MKQYILTETQLVSLLADYHKLSALENSGVDNWDWYSQSLRDYLDIDNNEDFESIAIEELKNYDSVD